MTRLLGALCALALLGLVGCQQPVFNATDVTGASFARDFTLTDYNGEVRRLADFRGKLVAIFFGYTHCPDVCPTTLSHFVAALEQMEPEDAARVQVIFVTVDPERDAPEVLRAFVPAFNPTFLGMYTDAESLRALAAEYKVVYQKTGVKAPDDYLIDHSAGTFVYDTDGRLRLHVPYNTGPDAIAQDLNTLLATSGWRRFFLWRVGGEHIIPRFVI